MSAHTVADNRTLTCVKLLSYGLMLHHVDEVVLWLIYAFLDSIAWLERKVNGEQETNMGILKSYTQIFHFANIRNNYLNYCKFPIFCVQTPPLSIHPYCFRRVYCHRYL